ncbi:shikimate dehydrogenase [Peptoniphilus equinus]|uniref:Shikimate dehydrogenase (NADP(+)) n=1 Tax=Peptoniphilus equinus TaxID=3016343 RepID=A0ABY7QTD0_9FIRM|nr:shikimate dehydrogenase [Peptoniphilus equinus]WBW50044.1 shikimate dehydrogenase [Peptoniphilus equinus]
MTNRIQGTTGLIGLLGNPIKHSRSPHMHNSAFDVSGEDYVYLCFEVGQEKLHDAIEALKVLGALGSNVTYPNKQEVLHYVDSISEDAKLIGSVNTIKIDPVSKQVTGYNTDGRGFVASIEEKGIVYKGKKVVIMGVGGAGRAIAIQLAYEGVAEIAIKEFNKDLAKEVQRTIEDNIDSCRVTILEDDEEALKKALADAVLLVNATPLGMKGNETKCAISGSSVLRDNNHVFVYDIVYEPEETLLMTYAKEAGCQTCNGINMMIWQGALAYKIWLDKDMPQEYVRNELFKTGEVN